MKNHKQFTRLFLLIAVLLFPAETLLAQYVRQETYSTEHQRRQQYALDDWISYLESHHINSMAVGTRYLYLGTDGGGVWRYNLYQNFWDYPFTVSNGLADNFVEKVVYDNKTGYLWAVTRTDVCVFKPAEQEWYRKSESNYWPDSLPSPPSAGSGNGIQYDVFYSADYLDQLPPFFVNGNYTLSDNWQVMDDYFDEYPITGFLKDHWERIWFAIDGLGVGIGSTFSQRMDIVPIGLPHSSPRVLRYQKDDLWIGGEPLPGPDRPAIALWHGNDGFWQYFQARRIPTLRSDNVFDIEIMGDSAWFATDYGVSLYNRKKESWKRFDTRQGLYSLEITDLDAVGNRLYIGTRDGLNIMKLDSAKIVRDKQDDIRLATIYRIAHQRDTLWLATNRGIFRYRNAKKGWESVTTSAPIQDLPVTAMTVFGDEIWFASPGGVFWLDTRTDKWQAFPQIGLDLNGPFRDIAVNAKSVWVSTPEGLLKYDRQRGYWRLFTTEDGLLDNRCRRLLLDGDYIWIATQSGICQFYWDNPQRVD